jgi:16S rRNA (cytidine1402-2'-O)-methyltransferase
VPRHPSQAGAAGGPPGQPREKLPAAGGEAAPEPPRGTLYVVATPIGNLGDITQRALDTLRAARVIAAEDTRHTRKLLSHFGIAGRLVSYHAHNRKAREDALLGELAQGDVALVSDAGTPVISDPGHELVRAAAAAGYDVVAVPGPSALTAALAVSGLPASAVHFVGFLPRRASERRRVLGQIAAWPGVAVWFEAPHRLVAMLADVDTVLGDRPVAVCCEITKRFEHVHRGTVRSALAEYRATAPRGEFTVVLDTGAAPNTPSAPGAAGPGRGGTPDAPAGLGHRLAALTDATGDRRRALSALAAETGIPRKLLYARLVVGRDSPGH